MRVAVLADTHIPKKAKDLPTMAYKVLENADAILHAGDVLDQLFIERLKKIAPIYAVLGNNDHGLVLPERLELAWEGINIAMVHDSGAGKGRGKRMRKWFPMADVVIFGHSHIPMNQMQDNGMLLFNPGSPTDKRRQPNYTMGVLNLKNGKLSAEIIRLHS